MHSLELIRKNGTRLWWLSIILAIVTLIIIEPLAMIIGLLYTKFDFLTIMLKGDNTIASDLIMLFSCLNSILFLIFCNAVIYQRPIAALGFHRHQWLKNYVKGTVFGAVLLIVSVLLVTLSGGFKIAIASSINYKIILGYLLGFMIQGMSEEVICRGFIQSNISAKFGMWSGIVLNTVVFALLHYFNNGMNILPMINLLLFGFFASLLYYYTDNIWLLGGLHSMWNFLQGPIFGIEVSGNQIVHSVLKTTIITKQPLISGGSFGIEGSLSTTICLILATLVIYRLMRKSGENKC